jgi:cytochrome d ubiquinol oxidase subunit II
MPELTALETIAWSDHKLALLWFALIAVCWIAFFALEGFDFGVAMLSPFLGESDAERRTLLTTVGPHWDGNEVWLLTAGGAMFAAFSGWYATLFASLYLPLFLVLVGLILRGVALEYRSQQRSPAWRATWDWLAAAGSLLPPLVLGVGFANFVRGIVLMGAPVPAAMGQYTTGGQGVVPFYDGFLGLFHPFCLLGGLLFVTLCLAQGALFLTLKTSGPLHARAESAALWLAGVAFVLLAAFVVWGNAAYAHTGTGAAKPLGGVIAAWAFGVLAVAGLAAAAYFTFIRRCGFAFLGSSLGIGFTVALVFAHMFPNLGFDLAVAQAVFGWTEPRPLLIEWANSDTTLTLMTAVAAVMVPVVALYQLWAYRVFRARLSPANVQGRPGRGARAA